MPFPLAHPAAVLPLKRYCPRYLSLPALVVGSIAPDAAYLLPYPGTADWSHTAWGTAGFALPVGLVGLLILYWADSVARRYRRDSWLWKIIPGLPPAGSAVAVVLSILLGAATHFLWDSFTHRNGWVVERSEFLQMVVAQVGNRSVRVCHLFWYFFSFVGVVWVWIAFEAWTLSTLPARIRSARARFLDALMFAALLVPIEVIHHNVLSRWGLVLAGVLTLGLLAGAAARLGCLARSDFRAPADR